MQICLNILKSFQILFHVSKKAHRAFWILDFTANYTSEVIHEIFWR